eukprot:g66.t1
MFEVRIVDPTPSPIIKAYGQSGFTVVESMKELVEFNCLFQIGYSTFNDHTLQVFRTAVATFANLQEDQLEITPKKSRQAGGCNETIPTPSTCNGANYTEVIFTATVTKGGSAESSAKANMMSAQNELCPLPSRRKLQERTKTFSTRTRFASPETISKWYNQGITMEERLDLKRRLQTTSLSASIAATVGQNLNGSSNTAAQGSGQVAAGANDVWTIVATQGREISFKRNGATKAVFRFNFGLWSRKAGANAGKLTASSQVLALPNTHSRDRPSEAACRDESMETILLKTGFFGEWYMCVTFDGDLAIIFHEEGKADKEPQMVITSNGKIWLNSSSITYTGTLANTSPSDEIIEFPDGASRKNGFYNGLTIQLTINGQTHTGTIKSYDGNSRKATLASKLSTTANNQTTFSIANVKLGAYLTTSTPTSLPSSASQCMYTIRIGNGWDICASQSRYLSLVFYGKIKMSIRDDGAIWGAFAGGFFTTSTTVQNFAASAADSIVNVLPVPGKPSDNTVTSSSISLTWGTPLPALVESHTISPRSLNDGTCNTFLVNCEYSDLSEITITTDTHKLKNLFAGQRYRFTIRFTYKIGSLRFPSLQSVWSSTIETLAARPSWILTSGSPKIQPSVMLKLPGMVVLSWTPPRKNGYDIDNYRVYMTTKVPPPMNKCTGNATSACSFGNQNDCENSTSCQWTSGSCSALPCTSASFQDSNTACTNATGCTFTDGDSQWDLVLENTPGAIGFVENLGGMRYIRFRVSSHNKIGWSNLSGTSTPVSMDSTIPARPTSVPTCPNLGLTTIGVSWTPPNDGGDAILQYKLQYNKDSPSFSSAKELLVNGAATVSAQLDKLLPGTPYYIRFAARNLNGWSEMSASSLPCITAALSCKTNERLAFIGASNEVECVKCADGKDSKGGQAMSCDPCSAGKYRQSDAMLACTDCSAGKISSALGASQCDPCAAGKYSSTPGNSECTDCIAGNYADNVGAVACKVCGFGVYTKEAGAAACLNCPSGKYNECFGSTSCNPCNLGTFSATPGQSSCTDCVAGQYQDKTGQVGCINCPLGEYMISPGQAKCLQCDLGQFASKEGSEKCADCSVGQHADTLGADVCKDCAKGKHIDIKGATFCQSCEEGKFQSLKGSSTCTDCPSGSYTSTVGNEFCPGCPSGKFGVLEGQEACLNCAVGKFSSNSSAVFCDDCPMMEYADTVGTSECKLCARGWYTVDKRSEKCTMCTPGFYSWQTPSRNTTLAPLQGEKICLQCPDGGLCVNGDHLIVKENYWREEKNSSDIYPCVSSSCLGITETEIIQLDPSKLNYTEESCRNGSSGVLCGICISDEWFLDATGACVPCSGGRDESISYLFMAVLFIIVTVALTLFLAQPADDQQVQMEDVALRGAIAFHMATQDITGGLDEMHDTSGALQDIKAAMEEIHKLIAELTLFIAEMGRKIAGLMTMFIAYVQVLCNMPSLIDVEWPEDIVNLFATMKLVNLDLAGFLKFFKQCQTSLTFEQNFYLTVAIIPGYLLLVAIISYNLFRFGHLWESLQTACPIQKKFRLQFNGLSVGDRAVKLVNTLAFLLYPNLGMKVFAILQCVEVEGEYFLERDLSIRCYEGRHTTMMIFAGLGMAIYVLGIPATYILALYGHRGKLMSMEEAAELDKKLGEDEKHKALLKDHEFLMLQRRYGRLFQDYRKETWWFEMMLMLQKLTLTAGLLTIRDGPVGRALAGLVLT